MARSLSIGLLSVLLICMSMKNVVSFNKYGRTCQDIGCRSDEVCELVSDCDTSPDRCGTYPTCKKSDKSGGLNCATKICPSGEYCKTVSGIPTCVNSFSGSESNGDDEQNLSHRQSAGTDNLRGTSGHSAPSAPYPTIHGSSYGIGSVYPSAPVDDSKKSASYPTNSAYPAGSGYPSRNSGYPASGSSGYPSSGSSGYPASGGSGYPSSGNSGYPSSGSSGYPSSGNSGYPSSGNSGYPASGNSGYPSSGSSGYPSSGSSGYPSSGSSGYPSGSENNLRRTSSSNVNAGYPGYPQSGNNYGGYPQGVGNYGSYPQGGYNQNGYPQGQYSQNGGYQGQYNSQYPNGGYPPTQQLPKKPSFTDQLKNIAKNLATRIVSQTIAEKLTGRH